MTAGTLLVGTVVLVGGDGDLVLQALTLPPSWDVRVLRELPSARSAGSLLCLRRLRRGLLEAQLPTLLMTGSPRPAKGAAAPRACGAELDLIALSCFMGNDYLPKLREAQFARLWAAYKALLAHQSFAGLGLLDPATRSLNPLFVFALMLTLDATWQVRDHRVTTA